MASIFNFFKRAATPEPQPEAVEQRSDTIPGPIVIEWDSAFGAGKNYDKLSVIYGCTNLLACTVASLPIQFNRKIEGGYEEAKDHPLYNLITKNPNNFQSIYGFYHWIIVQLCTFGNAYIQKIRNNAGQVIELIPINAYTIEVFVDETGLPYYKMNYREANDKSYYREYKNEEIIHFKGYSRNGIYGLSPIDTFRTLYDGYGELETAGTSITRNAAKPSGIVYYPQNMGEDALEKLKGGWKQGFSGTSSGKSAFIPNTIKVEGSPIGLSADQIQYIEQKKFSAQRIASDIFRVPLHMLGLSTSPTFASVEQSSIEWVSYTITPIVTNLEQQLQKQLLDNDDEYYVNFNVNGLLRGDIKTRIEFYRFGIEHGILTPNDVHEAEGTGIVIPEEKGGNSYVRPLNFATINSNETIPVAPAARSDTLSERVEATPAPKKEQIVGSDKNKEGSASGKSGDIDFDESTETGLTNKVKDHNEAMDKANKPSYTKVTLGKLKSVYRRGSGAYSSSFRKGISRAAWSMARVNAFLYLSRTGSPQNPKYITDNDLLAADHPKYSEEKKSIDNDEGIGYLGEDYQENENSGSISLSY